MTSEPTPRLLTGGNPQIPKGDGDAPVQAYIAAMPGWKRAVGHRLDALVAQAVPGVQKAVKWNQPFYGNPGDGFFLSFRCFTQYVQVAFHNGGSLDPLPPKAFKDPAVRALDIREHDDLDEEQLTGWIEHASRLPGLRFCSTGRAAG